MPEIKVIVFSSLKVCREKVRDKEFLNNNGKDFFYNNLYNFVDNIIQIRKDLNISKGFKALYFLYSNGEYKEVKVEERKNFSKNIENISNNGYLILVLE